METVYEKSGRFAIGAFPDIEPVLHMVKLKHEADEVIANPEDEEEYADCAIALFAAAYRTGISYERFIRLIEEKLEKISGMKWKKLSDGTYQSIKPVQIPTGVHIGKEESNAIMLGGRIVEGGPAQLFIRCSGNEPGCHESIALLPDKNTEQNHNDIIDNITDEQAGKIFYSHGWLVKGYQGSEHTRCPVCAEALIRIHG